MTMQQKTQITTPIENLKSQLWKVAENKQQLFEGRMKLAGLNSSFSDYFNDVWYEVSNSKELQACTPESIFDASMRACGYGLTIGKNKANLVPYGSKASFQVGYEGFVELLKRVVKIKSRDEDVIREGDEFSWNLNKKSTEDGIKSVASYNFDRKAKGNAKIIGAYCYVLLDDGNSYILYMDMMQIQRHRKETMFWKTWEDKMVLKTVIKELTKVLYKRYDNESGILDVIAEDDAREFGGMAEIKDVSNKAEEKPILTLSKPKIEKEIKEEKITAKESLKAEEILVPNGALPHSSLKETEASLI
jgi:recombination protein RecT